MGEVQGEILFVIRDFQK